MSSKAYQDAVEHLNSLQSNAATLDAVRASGGRSSEFAIPEMLEYLERIGYTSEQLNALNVIHITGTKGKGSTSAFTDSILRHAMPEWKVGLYTSPHLVAVRERIRINGLPISEEVFAKYFFEVWDRLIVNNKGLIPTTPPMPGYFRFITLMAFHVFLEEKVDATVLEVGVGGTYDSTNIVPSPVVNGITALGIDHVNVLGKTITEIAWQKGGIFKQSVPAFTVNQPADAMKMLESRAEELKVCRLLAPFFLVKINSSNTNYQSGLAGRHQVQNASLAISLSKRFLETRAGYSFQKQDLPASFINGLAQTKWPGRCQTVPDPNRSDVIWCLDGAHTVESLQCCMEWFVASGVGLPLVSEPQNVSRFLVFNCTSGRSGETFLNAIAESIRSQLAVNKMDVTNVATFFDHVIFCTNVTYADGHFKGDLTTKAISKSDLEGLKTQQSLGSSWSSLFPTFPSDHIHVLPSIEHAVRLVETIQSVRSSAAKVLVTGSLHLVGGLIEVAALSEVAL
ncbi:Mur ligase [Gymnopilus junonius]|uniref:Folylpolyglutamate synthase n=1 Tax=Gymnopilus junonius TaxID=109634 RepID=A0A9P5TVV3_GYMJU|nr:Mur ligase [Gymnopilus junonius]